MKKIVIIILLVVQHIKLDAQITMPDFQAMQYVNSNLGNALNFDGTNAYGLGKAYITDSLLDFTMEFWIKNTGTDGANDRIYASYLNNALQIGKSATHLKLMATDNIAPTVRLTLRILLSITTARPPSSALSASPIRS